MGIVKLNFGVVNGQYCHRILENQTLDVLLWVTIDSRWRNIAFLDARMFDGTTQLLTQDHQFC